MSRAVCSIDTGTRDFSCASDGLTKEKNIPYILAYVCDECILFFERENRLEVRQMGGEEMIHLPVDGGFAAGVTDFPHF